MADDPRPPLRQLADHLVRGSLDEFVRVRREAGRSWRLIERDLYQATKGKADVSFETLRSWYPGLNPAGDATEPESDGATQVA